LRLDLAQPGAQLFVVDLHEDLTGLDVVAEIHLDRLDLAFHLARKGDFGFAVERADELQDSPHRLNLRPRHGHRDRLACGGLGALSFLRRRRIGGRTQPLQPSAVDEINRAANRGLTVFMPNSAGGRQTAARHRVHSRIVLGAGQDPVQEEVRNVPRQSLRTVAVPAMQTDGAQHPEQHLHRQARVDSPDATIVQILRHQIAHRPDVLVPLLLPVGPLPDSIFGSCR